MAGHHSSLVPRPHPLTRRNSLVNQVEFLGLAHAFATLSPSNVQNIHAKPTQKKKGTDARVEIITESAT